jgi:hypothetical protein
VKALLASSFAILSLLACIATCTLWARSFGVEDSVEWRRRHAADRICTAPGHLVAIIDRTERPLTYFEYSFQGIEINSEAPPGDLRRHKMLLQLSNAPGDYWKHWEIAGFGWIQWAPPDRSASSVLFFAPLPAIVALAGFPPLVWLAAYQKRRIRGRIGLCKACGYDLRATPERCPECGAAAAAKT